MTHMEAQKHCDWDQTQTHINKIIDTHTYINRITDTPTQTQTGLQTQTNIHLGNDPRCQVKPHYKLNKKQMSLCAC